MSLKLMRSNSTLSRVLSACAVTPRTVPMCDWTSLGPMTTRLPIAQSAGSTSTAGSMTTSGSASVSITAGVMTMSTSLVSALRSSSAARTAVAGLASRLEVVIVGASQSTVGQAAGGSQAEMMLIESPRTFLTVAIRLGRIWSTISV